jgi:SAM-dependent methyltransferase
MRQVAAYDEFADWYEQYIQGPHYERVDAVLRDLIGRGEGACLEVCCGTGARAAVLRELGWKPAGVDLSHRQLDYAMARMPVVQGDAAMLPFRSASVQAVACVYGHTDLPEYAAVLREAARVLVPGGRYVHLGSHPCFVGAFADRSDSKRVVIDERYSDRSLSFDTWAPHGVRARVGAWHVPIADLLNAVTDSGLRVTRTIESGPGAIPDLFGFVALPASW